MYTCGVLAADPNWLCAAVAPIFSVLGFPLYEDTANGRAATHQLYSFAIEVWLGTNDPPAYFGQSKIENNKYL